MKLQIPSRRVVIALFALVGLFSWQMVYAQAMSLTQRVIVHNQSIVAGQIQVAEVVTAQDGWISIHRSRTGNLAEVIGLAPVRAGVNTNVIVTIDVAQATATMYLLLLSDAGQRGVYEFPGADTPIIVSNPPILAFQVAGLPTVSTAEATAPAEETQAAVTKQSFDPGLTQDVISTRAVSRRNLAVFIVLRKSYDLYLPVIHHSVTLQGVVIRSANLRTGPGLTFSIAGLARARQTVALVACDKTCAWYQLSNGMWISASLLQEPSGNPALLAQVMAP